MLVRPLRPVDLVALTRFQNSADEITAHTWPRVSPESAHLPILNVVSEIVAARVAGRRAWIARGKGGVVGLVVARARGRGLAWDVEHLHVDVDDLAVLGALLEAVFQRGAANGARRVFMETPTGAFPTDVARRVGFERFASSTLFHLADMPPAEPASGLQVRPRRAGDDLAVFQLYNAAVPASVRLAEAMTREEWLGLSPARSRGPAAARGSHRQFVFELGASLVGWMELRIADRSQHFELLVHPRFEDAAEHLVQSAIRLAKPGVSLFVSARDYQTALGSALTGIGAQAVDRHDVFVHLLAQPVRELGLVPAQAVRA